MKVFFNKNRNFYILVNTYKTFIQYLDMETLLRFAAHIICPKLDTVNLRFLLQHKKYSPLSRRDELRSPQSILPLSRRDTRSFKYIFWRKNEVFPQPCVWVFTKDVLCTHELVLNQRHSTSLCLWLFRENSM